MGPWAAIGVAAAGAALSSGIDYARDAYSQRVEAGEDRDYKIRQYQESVRTQQNKEELYTTKGTRRYGGNFIDTLKSGATVNELMDTGFGSNTAIGKEMDLMRSNANRAVNNATLQNQQTGVMANMQGQANLNQSVQQEMARQQAAGEAVSSQATSGIRGDRGTGGNTLDMQERRNRLSREQAQQQIAMQNKRAITSVKNTQRTALQEADTIRAKREISATRAVENALNSYSEHVVTMKDMDVSQENYLSDAQARDEDAEGNWFFDKSIGDSAVTQAAQAHDYEDVDYSDVEIKFEDDE